MSYAQEIIDVLSYLPGISMYTSWSWLVHVGSLILGRWVCRVSDGTIQKNDRAQYLENG